jgi:hypothetical protein
MREAADSDFTPHLIPAQALDQFDEHLLESDAVQRIIGLELPHCSGGSSGVEMTGH